MILPMALQIISAFFATIFFSVMFNISRKELLYCGLSGGLGWSIYLISNQLGGSIVVSTFLGALAVSFLSRYLAILRKQPVTIFLISGTIPLVPGAGMYQTMYALITQDIEQAATYGSQTLQMAGVIAIAMIIISSLPKSAPEQRKAH